LTGSVTRIAASPAAVYTALTTLECYDACVSGWTHFVASLVDLVERGVGSAHGVAA
jgi:hypothetical protein